MNHSENNSEALWRYRRRNNRMETRKFTHEDSSGWKLIHICGFSAAFRALAQPARATMRSGKTRYWLNENFQATPTFLLTRVPQMKRTECWGIQSINKKKISPMKISFHNFLSCRKLIRSRVFWATPAVEAEIAKERSVSGEKKWIVLGSHDGIGIADVSGWSGWQNGF